MTEKSGQNVFGDTVPVHPFEMMARSPAVYRPLTLLQMAAGGLLAATAATTWPLVVGGVVAAQGAIRLVAGAGGNGESIADRLSRKSPILGGVLKAGVGAAKMAAAFMLYSTPLAIPMLGFVPLALAAVTALAGAAGIADGIETAWPTPHPFAGMPVPEMEEVAPPEAEEEVPLPLTAIRNVNGVFNGLVVPRDLPVPPPPALPVQPISPAGPSDPQA